jgi:aminopeptidase N
MPVRTREAQGDTVRWRFERSPSMPTYLVAVAVGEFDALEDAVDGIRLRILTAKGKRDDARYAMAATKALLPYYRAYFGVPYALPKLDQLAVPGVRRGAMEDWGLISYSEALLLYDPGRSSRETQQSVYAVMAHEIAHQWFGDLVTAASWNEIWLNEAFATWMQNKATAHFNPDWQIPLREILRRVPVMQRDAGPATRAIRSGPVRETAVYDVFDGITYTKGGAVLEMVETLIGAEAFRAGLAAYFKGQQYSNATAGDLWHYLSQASGRDVGAVAGSWTDQPGYPLLQARVACAQRIETLGLEQQRFSTAGLIDATSLWQVPVAAAKAGAGAAPSRLLLGEREARFKLGRCASTPMIVDSGRGFFRVEYSPEHLRGLARAFPALSPSQRLALLTDTFALGQAGRIPMAEYVALLTRLPNGGDPASLVLFSQGIDALTFLDDALAGTEWQRTVRAFARKLLAPVLAQVGWKVSAKDGPVVLELRNDLIDALGRFDDTATLRTSQALFTADWKGTAVIAPTIRPAVMRNVARRADASTYAELVRRLTDAERVEDRGLYASALGSVLEPELAQRVLALSMGGTLPPDVASTLPGRLGHHPAHADRAYAFTKENFDALSRMVSEYGRAWLLPEAASGFNDPARVPVMLADQQALVGAMGESVAGRMAAEIELKGRIRVRDGASIATALARGQVTANR